MVSAGSANSGWHCGWDRYFYVSRTIGRAIIARAAVIYCRYNIRIYIGFIHEPV
jgi:hypothetical protein